MSTVLVVDDKELMRDSVASTLQRAGLSVVTCSDGEAALDAIAKKRPDAVLTDLKMPGLSGVDLLERIRGIDDALPVVLMTAFGTIETAVRAMRVGAFDYITKPFEGDQLVITVKRALEHGKIVRENEILRAATRPATAPNQTGTGLDRLIGSSPMMRRVKQQVLAVAESQGTVLVLGESGAGKEVVAKAVHELSPRREDPFLAVNCAALSETLLESELFGHEKGAFTGADKLRKGRFELADGGSLLLDEVSEITPGLQAKLLRVLQERAFERVGSSTTIGTDVRVIATSNRSLPQEVERGEFRQDLFFRLNVLPIHIPPLRDRIEDVAELANHFVQEVSRREDREGLTFADEAIDALQQYDWPGNVRELQNICERAVVLGRAGDAGGSIPADLIRPWLGGQPAAPRLASAPVTIDMIRDRRATNLSSQVEPKPEERAEDVVPIRERTLEEIERDTIVKTLGRFNGHRQRTARALGIGVRTLGLKLKKWKELNIVSASL